MQRAKPVPEATIAYPEHSSLSPQVSDTNGRFGGYKFEPGQLKLNVAAVGYKPKTVTVKVLAKEVATKLKLAEDPDTRDGTVQVRVFNEHGQREGSSDICGRCVWRGWHHDESKAVLC